MTACQFQFITLGYMSAIANVYLLHTDFKSYIEDSYDMIRCDDLMLNYIEYISLLLHRWS